MNCLFLHPHRDRTFQIPWLSLVTLSDLTSNYKDMLMSTEVFLQSNPSESATE